MMTKRFLILLLIINFIPCGFAQVSKMIGVWKIMDEDTDKPVAAVQIYKALNCKYYGKIIKLYEHIGAVCEECDGANKNQPIVGLVILSHLVEKNGTLTDGIVLDPKNGKEYHCHIRYHAKGDKLHVRGSLDECGKVGKTRVWLRTYYNQL
jgi:uncharacterized protein (DUF2147 family)